MTESEIKWSMSRLPVFQRMLDAACMAGAAGAEQAVVSDANTVSVEHGAAATAAAAAAAAGEERNRPPSGFCSNVKVLPAEL